METIRKTTMEFREIEMKTKMMECLDIRTRSYQHQGLYLEGDKVWYQYKDTNAWHGPASVLCQKGQSVFVHANGEIRKVHTCKVKPYELMEREEEDSEKWNNWKLKDDEEKEDEAGSKEDQKEKKEVEEDDEEIVEDGLKDVVGAKYLKMCHNVFFLETAVYSVEVPVREHGKVEVTEAKQKEVENLKCMRFLKKWMI